MLIAAQERVSQFHDPFLSDVWPPSGGLSEPLRTARSILNGKSLS